MIRSVICVRGGEEIRESIGMDAEYIVGIFVAAVHKGQGIGHQLIEAVKKKKRLFLYVIEKYTEAMAFYLAEGSRSERE